MSNVIAKKKFKKPLSYISLIILIILVSSAGYFLTYPNSSPLKSLGVGVISSLITSLVYGLVLYSLINEPLKDQIEIKNLLNELRYRELSGIENIDEKYIFEPDFWRGILEETNNELIIIGHALSTWVEEPYSEPFASNLSRIITTGGEVTLVTVDPDGETHHRLREAMGQSYDDRVERTRQFVKNRVLDTVDEEYYSNIHIKEVSELHLPYMLIKNDRRVVLSPYLAMTGSRNNILLTLSNSSKFGTTYYNDAKKIIKCSQEVEISGK